MGSENPSRTEVEGPSVFISYRRSDTETIAAQLASMLKGDLGSRNVYRDRDDMILGQPWREALGRAMSAADAALFLIGPGWEGRRASGRRIDDEDDVVRSEVLDALQPGARASALPLLIDRDSPPGNLPTDIAGLFDEPHYEHVSREDLASASSAGYQSILVGIWAALARREPRGVIILGESSKMVELDSLVEELIDAGALESQTLSRFASGVYVASWRDVKGLESDFPRLVVLSTGEPSEVLRARIAGFARHLIVATVVVTGPGAAALVEMGLSTDFGDSASTPDLVRWDLSQITEAATNATRGSANSISQLWTQAGTGAKGAIVASGVALAAFGTLLVANALDEPDAEVQADGRVYRDEQWADGATALQISDRVGGPRREPLNLTGPPDYEGFDDSDAYLSIGDADIECEFFVVVQFVDNRLIDGAGPDLKIFEIGPPAEPISVYAVRSDGSETELINTSANAGEFEFDLDGAVGDEAIAEIKICDLPGDFTGSPYPGADIDAVGAINSVDV